MRNVLAMSLASAAVATLNIPTKEIAPGVFMPMSGMGTWQYNSSEAEASVSMGLAYGVRSFDTAQIYGNQDGVGAALRKSGVPREEIFLTTKVNGGQGEQGTIEAHEQNLKLLGTDYADLLIVHFPCDFDQTSCNKAERQATWRGLETLQKSGKARAIGVSHYCQQHLEDIFEIATVPVALNQQEWHVGMGPDPEGVKSFCDEHNVTFQSFSPLCGPCETLELITGKLVTGIGAAHNKTGAQVSLRWLVENGSPVIAKTNSQTHMEENMDIFDFAFTKAELKRLDDATSPASVETVANDCKITLEV